MNSMQYLDQDGYSILESALSESEVVELRNELEFAFQEHASNEKSESVRHREGDVYAARNVLEICDFARNAWKTPEIIRFLKSVLGEEFGLVRGLFFDKPPDQTWALPWHKDLLIAIADGPSMSDRYFKPRLRAGVLHTEPPLEVLESMLTLRIHLDEVTDSNGPLEILPGSHRTGKKLIVTDFAPKKILVNSGDVLAMRPLLAHCSGRSEPESTSHRRILHLEFSGMKNLPDGFQWNHFDQFSSSNSN